MKERCRELVAQADGLFKARSGLESHWQDVAENFYPERADFTTSRALGTEFAANLSSSYPLIARRELANALSAMLRPRQKPWFKMAVRGDDDLADDSAAQGWLEAKTEVVRKVMYDPHAKFLRTTKEADNDFATFGQCVISPEWRRDRTGLIFRCWHLRDVAWCESAELAIDYVARRWKPTARILNGLFKGRVAESVVTAAVKEPERTFNCRHIVIAAADYDYVDKENRPRKDWPFVSLFVDVDNNTLLEERGVPALGYIIPRWQTVSGSQYAFAPSTVAALPDARLLQAITLTLLEAGEKSVDPPMVATMEAVRSDLNLYAGGTTWVDNEYDERLGEALRPITLDTRGLTFGIEMAKGVREMLGQAFYLNKITLPEAGPDMTAYEVQKRMEEYVRSALPLFEPMEVEYNAALCEEVMRLLMRANAFGSPDDIPESLQGRDVEFEFESPLAAATGRAKSQAFMQSADLLKIAAEIDPGSRHAFDAKTALRDALRGVDAAADWIRSPEAAQALDDQDRQAQAGQQMAGELSQGAQIAEQFGNAGKALNEAAA